MKVKKTLFAILIAVTLSTPVFAGWNRIEIARGTAVPTSEVIFQCSDCGAPIDEQGHCTGGCK